MTSKQTGTENWLPLSITPDSAAKAVRWMDFGIAGLPEPLFPQTVRRLRSLTPPAAQRTTDLATLLAAGSDSGLVPPSGLIFHISRCGSTLVSNALRTGTGVVGLSEAWPIEMLLLPDFLARTSVPSDERNAMHRTLANCVTSLYAHSSRNKNPSLFIKCTPAALLQIGLIRAIWPQIPAIVIIRDPVEVIVSQLKDVPAWRAERDIACRFQALPGEDASQLTVEEYCAQAIGRLCASACPWVGDTFRVVDYHTIDRKMVLSIAEFFGIELNPSGAEFDRVFSHWSKDPSGQRRFENDGRRKQLEASDSLRETVHQRASQDYWNLRQKQRW